MSKITKRRTETNIETYELTIIRAEGNPKRRYCQNCRTSVVAFLPEEIAEALRHATNGIANGIDTETLHFVDARTGRRLICGKSFESLFGVLASDGQ